MQIDRRPSIFNFLLVALLLAVLGGGERAAAQTCHSADFNSSGTVDGEDLAMLLAVWNTNNAAADINHDGVVEGADLTVVLASWGPCVVTPSKSKIMFIRHAEKPGCYRGRRDVTSATCNTNPQGAGCGECGAIEYYGVYTTGVPGGGENCPPPQNPPHPPTYDDKESLVPQGWERAGGIAQLFSSLAGTVSYQDLAVPHFIYASNYNCKPDPAQPTPSQRPYQTVLALSEKLELPYDNFITNYEDTDYLCVVNQAYAFACKQSVNILISWQHELILTGGSTTPPDSTTHPQCGCSGPNGTPPQCGIGMAQHLLNKCLPPGTFVPPEWNFPQQPWPALRYDMVLVFDLENGRLTKFSQVPQLLLAGDEPELFP